MIKRRPLIFKKAKNLPKYKANIYAIKFRRSMIKLAISATAAFGRHGWII